HAESDPLAAVFRQLGRGKRRAIFSELPCIHVRTRRTRSAFPRRCYDYEGVPCGSQPGFTAPSKMRYLDLTLPDADDNLALDEALLLRAESGDGGEVLRIWEYPRPVVVLGAGGRVSDDVHDANCAA